MKGIGNQQDYGLRIYDPRIAKFLSEDPLTQKYPELTPYQFASNSPIENIDLDGAEKLSYMDRIPTPTVKEGVANSIYNTLAAGYNGVAGIWNSSVDFSKSVYRDGLGVGTMNFLTQSYDNNLKPLVDYNTKTSWSQLKQNYSSAASDPNVYFGAMEQAAAVGLTWKFGVSTSSKPALPRLTAAEVESGGVTSEIGYNNGWRTPNGKFASPKGNAPLPGALAEESVWKAIESKPGWTIKRGRIAVRNAANELRYFDGVATSPSNKTIGLEIKSGTARRSKFQRAFDTGINESQFNTAQGVGASSGITVQRTLQIRTN